LGVCDKIVPGMVIGSLSFGHLPIAFIPAGPMPTGISNADKNEVRKKFANGEVDRSTLISTEQAAYHSSGTCTFYGTCKYKSTYHGGDGFAATKLLFCFTRIYRKAVNH
jgi:phosphogluconate dehydratase